MTSNLAEVIKQHTSSETVASIVQSCLDVKGLDVTVLDVSKISDIADYFVIVSGRSDRQVQGICNRVVEDLDQQGLAPLGIEGFNKAHWVLVDFGDVLLHVFYQPVREVYRLESLWYHAPSKQYA